MHLAAANPVRKWITFAFLNYALINRCHNYLELFNFKLKSWITLESWATSLRGNITCTLLYFFLSLQWKCWWNVVEFISKGWWIHLIENSSTSVLFTSCLFVIGQYVLKWNVIGYLTNRNWITGSWSIFGRMNSSTFRGEFMQYFVNTPLQRR